MDSFFKKLPFACKVIAFQKVSTTKDSLPLFPNEDKSRLGDIVPNYII